MATVAPATATVDPGGSPPLRLDSIPVVDLRLLSQSELHSLAKCTNSSSNLDRCDDVVIPKIDRSVFNESAGSRKQTYSRLRLAPAESGKTVIHRGAPRLRASHAPAISVVNDPEQAENSQIVRVLKEVFKPDSGFEDLAPIDVENDVVAPESLITESPKSLNNEAAESLIIESAELLNTEATESLNPEAPELINPEVHETLNSEATKSVSPKAPAFSNTEATDILTPEASELMNIKAPELSNKEAPELLNTEMPELLNTETKRKRGRPRKHESAVAIRPPVAKRMRNSTVKKVVIYDDNKDREIVNSRGVIVNLTDLGMLEDPYGPEIRRRTEGLSTSDELLGFLRGLNGQWGTTRKKRRVVDASDFGDVLPKGWKLSLCIKKKEGHVWLFCRRYISPSGRQFESCKDIAMYLLSVFGNENMDEPNYTHNKNSDDSALNGSSGNAANLYVEEDLERNNHFHNPSTPPLSLPDSEKQITYGIVGPVDVHVDDVYKCLKCFLIFDGKDELFDHKSLSHKDEKSQLDSPIPDWSIVVGGVFGCKFCHKTFYEINQYNEHIGTHATNENTTAEKTADPVLISAEIDHDMNFAIESKNIDEVFQDLDMNEDVLVEESGDGIGNKCVNDNDVPETEKNSDVSVSESVSNSECDLDQDIVGRSNGQDSGSETRVQSSSIHDEKCFQANNNDTRACNSFDMLTTDKGKVVNNESSSGFFHGVSNGQDAVSETRVHTSSIREEKGFHENINDMHMSRSFDELTSEKGKVVNNESSSGGLYGISDGQDAVSESRVQTVSNHEGRGFQENINGRHMNIFGSFNELTSEKGKNVNKESSSEVFHGGQDAVSETRVQTLSNYEEKGFQENINGRHIFGSFNESTSEKGKIVNKDSSSEVFHSGQDAVPETRVQTLRNYEEKGFQENINGRHIFSSFNELTFEKGKIVNKDSSSRVFHGGQDAVSENRVQTLSNYEEKGFQENINGRQIFSPINELTSEKGKIVNKDSSSGVFHNRLGIEEGRLAERKKLSESESLSLFSNKFKKAVHNTNLVSSKKQDSFQKPGFASVDPVTHGFVENRFSYNVSSSKLDEQYQVRNSEFDRQHVNKGYVHIENDNKSSEANLDDFQVFRNNQSINNEVQNGLNANVMDFNNPGKNIEFCSLVPPGNSQPYNFQDGLKFDDIFGDKFDENIHELSLAFGNPNALYEDTISVNEQKKVSLNCPPVASSKINDTFDVQTDLSMVNNSMVQDQRVNETRGFQNNGNSVYSGRTWGDYKSDEFRNSEDKKFMAGSSSNQMWKTTQGNHLQSGLVNSHAQIQTPNFHSFDIMSQKAQDGVFRQNERYNPSRSEPVEFRFLTDRSEHNPNTLQSGPRVFPYNYNTGIEQGFDSNVWMGKNGMMPNMSGRNVVISVCSWCRNQFYLPAMVMHQQTQSGVASLCPNCSAGISGQVNML